MYKIMAGLAIVISLFSVYFLSLQEQTWTVVQYKANRYVDNSGNKVEEIIPVNVTIRSSMHDLGLGLIILSSCTFLSAIYLFQKIGIRPRQ
jgi:hypothetical protein